MCDFLQSVSLSGIVYVLVSTVTTVSVHELGHALAAARLVLLKLSPLLGSFRSFTLRLSNS